MVLHSIHNTIYNDGGYDPNGLVGSANQVAKMRILEAGRNVKQVSEVKLGDELELRIDVNEPYSKGLDTNTSRSLKTGDFALLVV